jgi:hypothetical protein
MSFDWVNERAKCSLKRVFATLYEVVESDVKAANGLRIPDVSFHATMQSRKIIVSRQNDDQDTIGNVVFELAANAIEVREGADKHLFSARPSLTEDGKCKLEVDDKPFELWQVNRKALEDLFFGA